MKKQLLFMVLSFLSATTTFSQNWESTPTPELGLVNNISLVNDDVIWAKDGSTEDGFSISNDGGQTWIHKNFPALFTDNGFGLGILSAIDANIAYTIVSIATDPNLVGVYKTTDSGDTWVREPIFGTSSFPNQVHFWDANHGFVMGDGLELYVYFEGLWYDQSGTISTTGSWSVNSPTHLRVIENSAYFLTNAGTIMKSPDQGVSWEELATPFISSDNLSFDFKDDLNGVLVFNDNTTNQVYNTIDGGQNWTLTGTDVTNLNSYIKYIPTQDRYLSSYPGLSYSEDNGATWTVDPEFSGINLGEIESLPSGKIVIGGVNKVYFQNHPDHAALKAIYSSTNGDNWTNNTNWLDFNTPLNTWQGITTTQMHGIARVTFMNLGSNNLTGTLATEVGYLSKLNYLLMYDNEITGDIPAEVGNLKNLIELDLAPNMFTGTIPTEIGNLTNLETLWLNNNDLTGTIPASFQNLTNLTNLYLTGNYELTSNNHFSGTFPDLSGLPLQTLSIDTNNFHFEDLENQYAAYQGVAQFNVNPQYTFDASLTETVSANANYTFTLTDVGSGSGTNSYQWYKGGVLIPNADASSYTINGAQVADSGAYYCIITNDALPGMEIHRKTITLNVGSLGIDENQLDQVNIYPNPVTSSITISRKSNEPATITLFDVSGRMVLKQNIGSSLSKLNIEHLQNGMYILQLKSDNKTMTKQIIKQ